MGSLSNLALDRRDRSGPCCCSGAAKISDLMGDVAQGIKAFKKGMQDDDKTAEKPSPPRPSITAGAPSAARSDAGSKAV